MKTDVKTKLFKMDEIFNIYKGKRLIKSDMIEGKLNYIGAISTNNGVRQKIDAEEQFAGNCITVNYNGSVGYAFYQDQPFWASDDVNVLFLKDRPLTEHLALYLITVIKYNRFKFSYGRKWTLEKMSETMIALPVNKSNTPDYSYMESYISALKSKHIHSNIKPQNIAISISNWKDFKMADLFVFVKGKRFTKADMTPGKINFIGAISDNNGVRELIETEKYNQPNCITVNYNGSVGEAFYQNKPFWASDDVNILYAKNWIMNKFNALFIITIIKANRYRFSYGRKWDLDKMKETFIKLPAKPNGEPDFLSMENYIKSLTYSDKI